MVCLVLINKLLRPFLSDVKVFLRNLVELTVGPQRWLLGHVYSDTSCFLEVLLNILFRFQIHRRGLFCLVNLRILSCWYTLLRAIIDIILNFEDVLDIEILKLLHVWFGLWRLIILMCFQTEHKRWFTQSLHLSFNPQIWSKNLFLCLRNAILIFQKVEV